MNRTLYPLTQAQNLVLYEMSFLPYKEIVNVCAEFEFKTEINLNLMMQAINLAMMRNPNNYLRLTKENGKVMQYFTNDALDKIEYLEYTNENEYKKSLDKYFKTAFPKKQLETQLYRIRLIKKPNGLYAIDGCFSHICYDAYSIAMVFKDICECYKALLNNKPIPPVSISPIKAYEEENNYLNSNRMKTDLDYARDILFKSEPQFTCINGKKDKCYINGKRYGKYPISLRMSGGMLNLPIEKQLIDKINEYVTKKKISPVSIYVLAMRSFLAHVNETDDVMIQNIVGRRMTVAQKKAGGTMASAVFIRTIFDNDLTYNEALENVQNSVLDSYKHANLGTDYVTEIEEEKFKKGKANTYFTMALTYQHNLNVDDEIDYSFLRYPNGKEVLNVYLSIMPCDSKNNYVGNYAYQTDFVSEEKIREFHAFMLNFTAIAIENDEMTINEIIKKAYKTTN